MASIDYMTSQTYDIDIGATVYSVTVSMNNVASSSNGQYVVTAYGAVGDNSTDDTAAIQAAIDAAMADGYGGVVYFPEGLYKVTGSLTAYFSSFTSAGQITLLGAGKHTSRIIHHPTATEDTLIIDGWRTSAQSFYIHNLGFSKSTGTGRHAVYIKNASRGEINNCYIYGYAGGAGVKMISENSKNSDLNRIVGCYIGSCQDGVNTDCEGSSASYCDGHMIENCDIITNTRYDIYCGNSGGLSHKADALFVCNSWIQCGSTGTHGLYIDTGVHSVKMSNCNLDGQPATTCITVASGSDNCLFSNVAVDGGYVDSSGTAQFINCHFTATGQTNVISQAPNVGLMPSAEPAAPVEGMVYYDSGANKLKVYTGAAWETITSA